MRRSNTSWRHMAHSKLQGRARLCRMRKQSALLSASAPFLSLCACAPSPVRANDMQVSFSDLFNFRRFHADRITTVAGRCPKRSTSWKERCLAGRCCRRKALLKCHLMLMPYHSLTALSDMQSGRPHPCVAIWLRLSLTTAAAAAAASSSSKCSGSRARRQKRPPGARKRRSG